MRIFLAGATGAIGQSLTPMLVEAGHQVVGTTSTKGHERAVADMGAEPVVMDGLDHDAVVSAVTNAEPDVVIHQLTALKGLSNMKRFDREFALSNRLRIEGTDSLLAAARAAGARRFIAQSYTGWTNPRTGTTLKTEQDPLDPDPAAGSEETLAAIRHVERVVLSAPDLTGIVLRYGGFYGGGTGLSRGGDMLATVHKRKFPVVGGGTGVWSLVHIRDAARATALAVEHGEPGLYNVVDDDPAPVREWLPVLAEEVGAKPPMRLPGWLARPLIGPYGMSVMTEIRGSSNAKAKRELGWTLEFPTWRQGFRTGLG
ncbi:MAG: NAD-dependent epimerase/dehydratase family protein [Nocardioidaceae bacterium]